MHKLSSFLHISPQVVVLWEESQKHCQKQETVSKSALRSSPTSVLLQIQICTVDSIRSKLFYSETCPDQTDFCHNACQIYHGISIDILTQLFRICMYNLKGKSSYHIQVQKISTAKLDVFMIFFSTHILKILQDMKLEILSVAFCMCIQNGKQFDEQI